MLVFAQPAPVKVLSDTPVRIVLKLLKKELKFAPVAGVHYIYPVPIAKNKPLCRINANNAEKA